MKRFCTPLALACAAAFAAPAPSPSPAQTTYSVVNLGVGLPTELPKINNKGQVAFSVRNFSIPAQFRHRALFYDGARVHDIGNLGVDRSFAMGVNDAGVVVGYSLYAWNDNYFDGPAHAFRWTRASGIIDLGALPQTYRSYAVAVNNGGVAVGGSAFNGRLDEQTHAIRWSPSGAITDLGTFFGASTASAINDAGQIAGGVGFEDRNVRAFFWTRERGMTDLGSLGSGQSSPIAMNASGQIAGDSPLVQDGESHAFFWRPWGRMVDLGTLGGNRSRSVDINDLGQVVGVASTARGQEHAFIWYGSGRLIDLGTLGGTDSAPFQINRHGQVVGGSVVGGNTWHAFSWTRGRGMVDLNWHLAAIPRGMVIESAQGIGDDGTIVAMSNAGLVVLKPGPVHDRAPLVGPVVNAASARVNTPLHAVIQFLDRDRADTHRGNWDWGDGTPAEAAAIRERDGIGIITGTHRFREPGDYIVVMTVTDSGGRQSSSVTLVSVCNPSTGEGCRP
jgi:probable HAF family extracellular repeat protein